APVQAQQPALAVLVPLVRNAGGDEDPVPVDDGRGVADAGDGDLPAHVLGLAPLQGLALLERGAVAARPAPGGPVFGAGGGGQGRGGGGGEGGREQGKGGESAGHGCGTREEGGRTAGGFSNQHVLSRPVKRRACPRCRRRPPAGRRPAGS